VEQPPIRHHQEAALQAHQDPAGGEELERREWRRRGRDVEHVLAGLGDCRKQ
jgi:hypothetical protein